RPRPYRRRRPRRHDLGDRAPVPPVHAEPSQGRRPLRRHRARGRALRLDRRAPRAPPQAHREPPRRGGAPAPPVASSTPNRYALRPGDLVMTEGGDPDKLGRAAIWQSELPYCAHQNHVFRVRADEEHVSPLYLREVAGSAYGKGYFLSVAKQTTGIA